MTLAYLFECHYNDGTVFQQNPEDISAVDPTRSAFHDVANRIDDVIVFGLFPTDPENLHTYAVDLRTGKFFVDENEIGVQNPTVVIPDDAKYKLIFYRKHTHTITVGASEFKELGHDIEYHIGWQTTDSKGQNHQQTISVR